MKHRLLLIMSVVALQLNAQMITSYTTVDGLLTDFIECVEVDVNDNIWFGTNMGLSKFDGSNWTNYNSSNTPELIDTNIQTNIQTNFQTNIPFFLSSTAGNCSNCATPKAA
mgnify:CR=1 FL=1